MLNNIKYLSKNFHPKIDFIDLNQLLDSLEAILQYF